MRDEMVRKIVEKFARQVLVFGTWFVGYIKRSDKSAKVAKELAEAEVLLARLKNEIEEMEE